MQRLLISLLRLLGPRWQLSPTVAAFFERASRIGKGDHIPTRLIPLGARLWARGWFNKRFFDTHLEWVLPYWATRQLNPNDVSFVARGLKPVLVNENLRDWTTIGNPESRNEAIVDPRGLVTPQPQGAAWSLDVWLEVDSRLFFPSRLADSVIHQQLFENLPLVQTQYEPERLRVNQEVFAVQDSAGKDWVIASVTVENPRGDSRTASLYLSVRPFNPEGAALIGRVEFRNGTDNVTELWVNGEAAALILKPNAIACGNEASGDVALALANLNGLTKLTSESGVATAVAQYSLDLRPHSNRVITAVLPMQPAHEFPPDARSWVAPEAAVTLRREATTRWRELMQRGMQIRVPDDELQNAFEANKAYLLLFHDGDSITPGPFLYHDFWFRDAAYMLNALDQLGYHQQANTVLARYFKRLQKDGYLLAQEGEWDSNGQALWTLVEHARLSGDYELLAQDYWNLLNAAHWIDATRQKTKSGRDHPPEYGLLPAGLSAEHLGPNDYFYWDDFWSLAGLRAAVYAAKIFDNADDTKKLQAGYDAMRADVNASIAATAARTGALWIPASPYRNADSAMVANLAALYPLRLFAPDDPCLLATQNELKRIAWMEDALFHHVGHAGFGTYLSLHVAGCYLYQRNPEAWKTIRWLLKHATPTHTWAEAIHPRTRRGGMGDGHHGWAAAEFVSSVRNALLFEEDEHLVLTPALPDDWVVETFSIRVENAATYFGKVGYTIAFGDHTATLVLKPEWRQPPTFVEWDLPFAIKTAGGDGGSVDLIDEHRLRVPVGVNKVVALW